MVKGVTRRVIVVQPDNRALFEQAIFLVRDHSMPQREVVREACRIADRYLLGAVRPIKRRYGIWQMAGAFLLGIGLTSIAWISAIWIL